MNRTYRTEGVVLNRINFGEADRILTIYTKHYGKIKVLAKGVRKLTSRKGGNVELFNHLILFVAKGKNLDLLTEVQTLHTFKSWRKNLKKVALAYYFSELVDKLTPEGQANKVVFGLLLEFLDKITNTGAKILIRDFEESLLNELGFGVPKEFGLSSLKDWIEQITERKIKSFDFLIKNG